MSAFTHRSGHSTDLVNRDVGDCGASSSNGAGIYVPDARRQGSFHGVGAGRPGKRGPRARPSCGNRGARSRRFGPEHAHR